MKKWIFPICLVSIEAIVLILLLPPKIFEALPLFMRSSLRWIESCFTFISKGLKLPSTAVEGQANNYVFSNIIVLFVLDLILISINFIVFGIKKRQKLKIEKNEDKIIEAPKSEFDPILFEKKTPTLRLAFIWVPINYWILYYIVLNSSDFQSSMKNGGRFFYNLFASGIYFYDNYVNTILNKNVLIDISVFFIGLTVFVFIYWLIFSLIAVIFKKPFLRLKANRALKDHERRVSACQKEEIVIENIDILEHAKFKHEKSIVETIADIDKSKNPMIIDKSDYFSDVIHGITDLGVINGEVQKIEKPHIERKPIQMIFEESPKVENKAIYKQEQVDVKVNNENDKKQEQVSEDYIELDARFDPLKVMEESNVDIDNKDSSEQKIIVKPLKPLKLRDPVSVTPVKPITVLLKKQESSEPIIEIAEEVK